MIRFLYKYVITYDAYNDHLIYINILANGWKRYEGHFMFASFRIKKEWEKTSNAI